MTSHALLTLTKLACRRGGQRLFHGLDLEIQAGELVWLRGRNGSGKTSLLRLAAGLCVPERGQVLWSGVPAAQTPGPRGRPLFIGHANALKDELHVDEALQFLLRLQGQPCDLEKVHAALWQMGQHGPQVQAPVRRLTQGQRRRAALARLAAAGKGGLWVLDEPFDGLDTEGIERLQALLSDHMRRGGAVLLTSHQRVDLGTSEVRELDLSRFAPSASAPAMHVPAYGEALSTV